MSEHFFTFIGVDASAGQRVVNISGLQPGDRIIELLAVIGDIGSYISYFAPYVPAGGMLLQMSHNFSAYTFLLRVERDDI